MQFDNTTAFLIAGLLHILVPFLIWWLLFDRNFPETRWWCLGGVILGFATLWVPLATGRVPSPFYSMTTAILFFSGFRLKSRTLISILSKPYVHWHWNLMLCAYVLIGLLLELPESRKYSHNFTVVTHGFMYAYLAWKAWQIYKYLGRRSSLGIFLSYLVVVFLMFTVPLGQALGGDKAWSSGIPFGLLIMTGILVVFVNHMAFMGLVLEHRLSAQTDFFGGAVREQSRSVIDRLFWVSERERVLAGMARRLVHEINQPLTSLLSTVRLMRKALHDERWPELNVPELVDRMDKNLMLTSDVVNQIRPLAKGKAMDFQVLDLHDLTQDAVDLLHVPSQNIHIHKSEKFKALKVSGNRIELVQVLVNLLRNAIQAAEDRGMVPEVVVELEQRDLQVCLVITDNGPGFLQDVLPKLGREIFSSKAEGMGLGLWISQDIIESHGGQLTYRNRSDSTGAEVMLCLPLEL
jgi:signal transduction histidine kinase